MINAVSAACASGTIIAGKADQVNLFPFQRLHTQFSARTALRPDLEIIQIESNLAAFFCSRIS